MKNVTIQRQINSTYISAKYSVINFLFLTSNVLTTELFASVHFCKQNHTLVLSLLLMPKKHIVVMIGAAAAEG